ncbi:hypothetical protein XI05_16210 [Bradyrhizobium sp. CCBAU 11357]|nr:hypothetical protein [Bradyrhizobium sp. CCBAU 11357]
MARPDKNTSLSERRLFVRVRDDDVTENSSLPELIFGMLRCGAGAVVMRKQVVRLRRLEFVRNGDRQESQREHAEPRRAL